MEVKLIPVLIIALCIFLLIKLKKRSSSGSEVRHGAAGPVLKFKSGREVREWFFYWLAVRRLGEEITDNTSLSPEDVAEGFAEAKDRYDLDYKYEDHFLGLGIKTVREFIVQLEVCLAEHPDKELV